MASKIPPGRLDEIERRVLHAEHPADIERALSVEWHRTRRQVRRYLAIVNRRLAERAKARAATPETDAELVRSMLLRAYRTAEVGGEHGPDAKAMVQAAKTFAEVTGASAPRKHDFTSGGKPVALQVFVPGEDEP